MASGVARRPGVCSMEGVLAGGTRGLIDVVWLGTSTWDIVGVFPDWDNVGEVFGVMAETDETVEVDWEAEDEEERDIFGETTGFSRSDSGSIDAELLNEWQEVDGREVDEDCGSVLSILNAIEADDSAGCVSSSSSSSSPSPVWLP